MKNMRVITLAFVTCFLCAGIVYAKRPMEVKVSAEGTKVTLLEGTADIMPEKETAWLPLKMNNLLKDGDKVRTGENTRLELTLPDGTILRFADNTSFKIVTVHVDSETKERNIKVDVTLGKTWANIANSLGVKSSIEISCENAVTGVRGTIYRMNVYRDSSALVRVYDGTVSVWGQMPKLGDTTKAITEPYKVEGPKRIPGPRKVSVEEWTYIVRSMQQIVVKSDGTSEEPRVFTQDEDRNDWVIWNQKRDDSRIRH